ncbi:hypothetical protein SUGI_0950970 [Cryptomeria japonica]|nr:hypothetical protein SUGI_0950970 [Cryptomeria japonica]
MKQLTRSSSYSWWRESHNRPNQSAWLRNALEELDEKTQNILNLVEAEADSFAQRAENFYHKRPQLITMIEEYYRAYRSLAEQLDHLKGEIRQNVPKPLQVKYGLSCEAPLESPFRKQFSGDKNQRFKELLRRHETYGSDSEVSEVDDPEPEDCNRRSRRHSDQESIRMIPSDLESESTLSYSDSEAASHVVESPEIENVGSKIREMQAENLLLVKQLTAKNIQVKRLKIENNKLKKEKAFCKEEMSLVVQDRSLLEKELETIKSENAKLRNENEVNVWERNDLHKALEFIRYENTKLQNENEINGQQLKVLTKKVSNLQKENKSYKSMSLVLGCVNGEAARLARSNVRLRNEMCGGNKQSEGAVQILKKEKNKVEIILEAKENLVMEQSFKIKELQNEVCDRELELDVIKAENTKLRNKNEEKNVETTGKAQEKFISEQNLRIEELQREVYGLVAENSKLRDETEVNVQQLQVLKENVSKLQEENIKLCTQSKNVEITLEAKEKLVMEQNLRIGELQNEVYQLLEENRVQEIQLLERDEQKREAIRQLCFTLDALMDKNKRLQEALQKLQREVGKKPNNIGIRTSRISRWQKFLFPLLDGRSRPLAI